MTETRIPPNAPRVEHNPFACAAHGCPQDGTSKSGSDWLCSSHVKASPGRWAAITARLVQRKPIIKAMNLAFKLSPSDWQARQAGAAALMEKLERPDLVPKRILIVRKSIDPVTRAEIAKDHISDELEFPCLWAARLSATIHRECCEAVPSPMQPATQATGSGPQSFGSFLPVLAMSPFIVDSEEYV